MNKDELYEHLKAEHKERYKPNVPMLQTGFVKMLNEIGISKATVVENFSEKIKVTESTTVDFQGMTLKELINNLQDLRDGGYEIDPDYGDWCEIHCYREKVGNHIEDFSITVDRLVSKWREEIKEERRIEREMKKVEKLLSHLSKEDLQKMIDKM